MWIKFSSEQVKKLRLNPCVFKCTNNLVNYTFDFKKCALKLNDIEINAR